MIPLFPLGTVLVPHLVLPLNIFEPRYRTLVANLLDRDPADQEFGVIAIRQGAEVGSDSIPSMVEMGTTATLQNATLLDDGRYDIITVGHRRFRLLDVDDSLPYLQGHVEFIDEPVGACDADLISRVAESFAQYRQQFDSSASVVDVREALPNDPVVLSYLVASALAVNTATQQGLLEDPDAAVRLRNEIALLRDERALMKVVPSLPIFEPDRRPSLN